MLFKWIKYMRICMINVNIKRILFCSVADTLEKEKKIVFLLAFSAITICAAYLPPSSPAFPTALGSPMKNMLLPNAVTPPPFS